MDKITDKDRLNAEKMYPGAGVDNADGDKVSTERVRRDVKHLNNNPRNNKLDE